MSASKLHQYAYYQLEVAHTDGDGLSCMRKSFITLGRRCRNDGNRESDKAAVPPTLIELMCRRGFTGLEASTDESLWVETHHRNVKRFKHQATRVLTLYFGYAIFQPYYMFCMKLIGL